MALTRTSAPAPGREPGTPSPDRRRRRPAWWVGLALVLAGLGLLGYLAWQIWGTNVIAEREHRRLVEEAERAWALPSDGPVPTGEATALVRIPRFGDDYVVPVLEGTSDEIFARGFGHFEGSADPGEVGNYAIAGHRITHGEPLADMPLLRPGDEVIVETREATHVYVLDTDPNELIVTFDDVWVVDPLPTNPVAGGVQPEQVEGQRLITLTTCAELFRTDDRMVVFGHLVETVPKL